MRSKDTAFFRNVQVLIKKRIFELFLMFFNVYLKLEETVHPALRQPLERLPYPLRALRGKTAE
jgi:hypothetical protein